MGTDFLDEVVADRAKRNPKFKKLVAAALKKRRTKKKYSYIPCRGYVTYTLDGTDYDCRYRYSGDILCDECICGGGEKDPRTGKKVRCDYKVDTESKEPEFKSF